MDQEILEETFNAMCKIYRPDMVVNIKNQIDDQLLIQGKYLYVHPPIPGESLNENDQIKNLFNMQYNQRYNVKYNINIWDSESDSIELSDETEKLSRSEWLLLKARREK